jgi:hypothetical protein
VSFFNAPPHYRTFLLTLWEERNQDANSPAVWRFHLEDPRTGQRQGFASLAELISFLQAQLVDLADE